MTRDWITGKSIKENYQVQLLWKDLILEDEFGITEEDWKAVIQQTATHIRDWGNQTVSDRVFYIVDLLLPPLEALWQGKKGKDGELSFHSFRWLPCHSLKGATVADHALTASAIAYCLAYDEDPRPDDELLNKIRLSAMTATWQDDGLDEVYNTLWSGHTPIEPKSDGNEIERIVYLAKTVASNRCKIKTKDLFDTHPLNMDNSDQKPKVGLVLGGATKIKGYFLESAKLPEIRGASALLDRINLEDVPALFGREIQDKQRYEHIRKGFCKRTGHTLSAPECIIYAAGGNTLAFTPTSVVHAIADEIERIYTHETLVANSVAVGDTFDLLELQYGLNPTNFWVEDFCKACEDTETAELMVSCYGSKDRQDFLKSKCFGELTTKLAQGQLHRREGNPTLNRTTQRDLPAYVEIDPYQERCESCDRRPAIFHDPRKLCEACTRKYIVGRITKKETETSKQQRGLDHYLKGLSGWEPATRNGIDGWSLEDWSSLFKKYLRATHQEKMYIRENQNLKDILGPQDLEDIAKASDPNGFIAFVYADGNNMGTYLENIASPAQYRQFSERVFVAMQKAAFDALAAHLTPTKSGILPFEIISIGGDDLLLIVPGNKVFGIVHAIGEKFDSEFNSYAKLEEKNNLPKSQRYNSSKWLEAQEMQPVFSMSLGFVIAEAHTPVGFLEHLSGSLLKSAKTRAKMLIKDKVGYRGGTVDFLVLKSISMITSNLGDFRKKFYKTDTKNSLTMRPFTLYELDGFIKTIKAFKKDEFPQSQLYQLRESLKLGKQTSTLDYLYFRSRLKEGKGKLLQSQIEHSWQSTSDSANGQGPWYAILQEHRTGKAEYETLLFDIIEAYDFTAETEDRNEEDISAEFNN